VDPTNESRLTKLLAEQPYPAMQMHQSYNASLHKLSGTSEKRLPGSERDRRPEYDGEGVNWYTFLSRLKTYLGNIRVPKRVEGCFGFGSDIFDCPSSTSFTMVELAPQNTAVAKGTAMVYTTPAKDPTQK
jgi:hypothetical protein